MQSRCVPTADSSPLRLVPAAFRADHPPSSSSRHSMTSASSLQSPHFGMLALEPVRAMLEFARMQLTDVSAANARGDGHAVVLFPGLGADHRLMDPLARHCDALGY